MQFTEGSKDDSILDNPAWPSLPRRQRNVMFAEEKSETKLLQPQNKASQETRQEGYRADSPLETRVSLPSPPLPLLHLPPLPPFSFSFFLPTLSLFCLPLHNLFYVAPL